MIVDFVSLDQYSPEIVSIGTEDPCQHIGFASERRVIDPRLSTMPAELALIALRQFDGDIDEMRFEAQRLVSYRKNPPAWAQLVLNS